MRTFLISILVISTISFSVKAVQDTKYPMTDRTLTVAWSVIMLLFAKMEYSSLRKLKAAYGESSPSSIVTILYDDALASKKIYIGWYFANGIIGLLKVYEEYKQAAKEVPIVQKNLKESATCS